MLLQTSIILLYATALATPLKRQSVPTGFNWGNEKIRGVNLGGWLLLEPWITPTIFRKSSSSAGIVDEYTLCKTLGRDKAHDEVLQPHWNSWITLADFDKIAQAGFNVESLGLSVAMIRWSCFS